MFVSTKRERERERVQFNHIYLVALLIFALVAVIPSYGEGSREYNAIDSSVRSYLRASADATTGETATLFPHYVYMKAGEKMYFGSSVYQRTDFEVDITDPSGDRTTYNVDQNGNGHIQTRAQEKAGPKPLNNAGYSPITYTASAEGIYRVRFYGAIGSTIDSTPILNSQEWSTQDPTHNVAAWDITVVSANGTRIDGRVYCARLSFSTSLQTSDTTTFSLYGLTDNGYLYKVTLKDCRPGGYEIGLSNMGAMVNNHSAYSSFHYGSTGYSYFLRNNFNRQSNDGIMYKSFYNRPNSDLLKYLGLPADGSPIIPEITNFSFTSSSSNPTNTLIPNEGGTFNFDSATEYEKYILTLNFGNGNEIKKYGTTSLSNSIEWDGRDANGNYVQAGSFTARLDVQPGETHFVVWDFEYLYGGIVFQHLNGASANSYLIYYDHTPKSVDGSPNNMDSICTSRNQNCPPRTANINYTTANGWIVDAGDTSVNYISAPLDGSNGVDSSSGISKTNNYYSDWKLLDFWCYDDSMDSLFVTVLVNEQIDIQVNKVWQDDEDRDGMRPSTISVKLLQNEIEYDTAAITGSAGNTWTYTFQNLPKYNTDGELFEYSVEEVVE